MDSHEAKSGRESQPELKLGGSDRASRDAHLSNDKTVAKMGHPVVAERAQGVQRRVAVVRHPSAVARNSLPKLETFPAVTQKGEAADWLGGDDAKLATVAREMSPQALKALQELQESQSQQLTIAAIEIKPLQ